jgi:hypothetical protein
MDEEMEIWNLDMHIAALIQRGLPGVVVRDALLLVGNADERRIDLRDEVSAPAAVFVTGYLLCWADAALNAGDGDDAAVSAVMLGAADALSERINGQWN